jgi:hypothetical protein
MGISTGSSRAGMPFRVSLLLAALFLAGCHPRDDADRKAAVECVRANLAAMEKGDLDAATATVHPLSPSYPQAMEQTQAIFAQYKVAFTLEKAEVTESTPEGIRVHFVQVTKKLEGPDTFPDHRSEGTHLLRRDGEKWKIWSTQITDARTLDGQPLRTQ